MKKKNKLNSIIPEKRRAKRNKKWLKNNTIPLTEKEKRSIRNKEYYHKKIKPKREAEKLKYKAYFNNELYRNNNYHELKRVMYNYHVILTYKDYRNMYSLYKNREFVSSCLINENYIDNIFSIVEYSFDNNHIHILLNTRLSKTYLQNIIFKLYNGSFYNGNVKIIPIESEEHRLNCIDYLLRKLHPVNRYNYHQQQIDYWSSNNYC